MGVFGRKAMPPEDEQTQQLSAPAAVAEAPGATPPADPLASTLSLRPKGDAPPAAVPPDAARAGRELGAVRLLREIGRGATGCVFLGHHTVLGRDVAVKFLLNVRCSQEDPVGLKRFLDEARAAAAVRHPNLTQIYHADVDDADGTPFLVLEYVRGPTLKQLLDQTGPLDLPAVVAVVADAAAAVHELHAQGLIHRDIKPSNVLLDADGKVFVTDFGLALRQSHGHAGAGPAGGTANTSDFAGTPAYMAPEMFDGRVSPRGDVYALGVMTYQLLTGSVPFSGPFEELRDRHLREPLPSDALRARGVKPEVVEVVERCTNKQPMFRYKTPTDLARALKQAAGCEAAELARARKKLCDSIAGRRAFAAAASGEPLSPSLSPGADDDRPSSTSYPEFLARFATIRRERRTHAPADGEGSSGNHRPAGGAAAYAAGRTDFEPDATASEAGKPAPALPLDAAPDGPRVVPGPVLAASVLGILYGSLLAVWAMGEAVGAPSSVVPAFGPPTASAPWSIVVWRVLVAVIGVVLSMFLIAASAGCFKMRPWARRLMVGYAAADLAFQALVILLVFAWAGPATVNAMVSASPSLRPEDRTGIELSVYVWAGVRWLALSVFPAAVLALMLRRQVRRAFPERGPAVAPVPLAVPPPPS